MLYKSFMPSEDPVLCSATFFELIVMFAVCGYFLLMKLSKLIYV